MLPAHFLFITGLSLAVVTYGHEGLITILSRTPRASSDHYRAKRAECSSSSAEQEVVRRKILGGLLTKANVPSKQEVKDARLNNATSLEVNFTAAMSVLGWEVRGRRGEMFGPLLRRRGFVDSYVVTYVTPGNKQVIYVEDPDSKREFFLSKGNLANPDVGTTVQLPKPIITSSLRFKPEVWSGIPYLEVRLFVCPAPKDVLDEDSIPRLVEEVANPPPAVAKEKKEKEATNATLQEKGGGKKAGAGGTAEKKGEKEKERTKDKAKKEDTAGKARKDEELIKSLREDLQAMAEGKKPISDKGAEEETVIVDMKKGPNKTKAKAEKMAVPGRRREKEKTEEKTPKGEKVGVDKKPEEERPKKDEDETAVGTEKTPQQGAQSDLARDGEEGRAAKAKAAKNENQPAGQEVGGRGEKAEQDVDSDVEETIVAINKKGSKDKKAGEEDKQKEREETESSKKTEETEVPKKTEEKEAPKKTEEKEVPKKTEEKEAPKKTEEKEVPKKTEEKEQSQNREGKSNLPEALRGFEDLDWLDN